MSVSGNEILAAITAAAVEYNAADIFLHEGKVPQLRLRGELTPLQMNELTPTVFEALRIACHAPLETVDFDGSYVADDGTRFRVNILSQLGLQAAVLRKIRRDAPNFLELGLPAELLTDWMSRSEGIVLVCGPTGSGKSTSLAACLEWINQNFARHIVTIEDPVEFVFESKRSLFSQREVGIDTATFAEGLRRSLRQSPDVILLGEIRDSLSASTAVQAAETGHLVLATLHAANSADAVERFSQLFPVAEREALRRVLASQLIGVLCQRLLPAEPEGMALLLEYFTNIGASRKFIEEAKNSELADLIARADPKTSRNFLSSLVALCQSGKISEATAVASADNPQEVQRALRGINSAAMATRR